MLISLELVGGFVVGVVWFPGCWVVVEGDRWPGKMNEWRVKAVAISRSSGCHMKSDFGGL